MNMRGSSRISPIKPLHVQISNDTTAWNGTALNISCDGSCICLQRQSGVSIYPDNRVLIRYHLNELNERWMDEALIGRVRWMEISDDDVLIGVEFMDTHEYYHPMVSSLRPAEAI